MNKGNRDFISILLSVTIIVASLLIIHRFILPLAWAATIAIATFPIYLVWQRLWGRFAQLAALSFTLMVALIVAIPLTSAISLLIKETHAFFLFLMKINKFGEPVPLWIQNIPWLGTHLTHYWDQYLASPNSINQILTRFHLSIKPASLIISHVGVSVAGKMVVLFFFILCLFFMYRDGTKLVQQINQVGQNYLGQQWTIYAHKLPAAIRATVNGTIFVGLGVGILLAISYSLAQVAAPVLLGFATALLAMIPFGAPLIFVSIAVVLLAQGYLLSGFLILGWGLLVMFVADHLIKPFLIGNATRLHFLAVLFGILGGVETLGLIGLFLGPIIITLFTTWWNESQKPTLPS